MLYNEKVKERYLQTLENEERVYLYKSKLEIAYVNEVSLERDLYDFTEKEILDTILGAELPSIGAVRTTLSIFKTYIRWAASNGYVNTAISPIGKYSNDELSELVDKNKKVLMTYGELIKIQDTYMANAQDRVVSQLIFEGIYGSKMVEIANLHYNDINWNKNELRIRGGDDKRTVIVSDRCMRLIENAYKEEDYLLANGFSEGYNKVRKLIRNDYIVRGAFNGRAKEGNAPTTYGVLYNRVRLMRDLTDKPFLTPKTIHRSGMLYYAYLLHEETKRLDREEYLMIAEKFQIGKTGLDKKYYALAGVKEFVNMETLKEYYSEENEEEIVEV